jgi:mRNA-degrading endonuclease RelE of RelBE toxin-antitoxin system
MKVKVILSSKVLEQMEALPARIVNAIVEKVDLLPDFPFAGQAMAEYRRRSYRRLIGEDHRLIYRVDGTLHVVRVLWVQHCRISPPKAKELKQAEEQ